MGDLSFLNPANCIKLAVPNRLDSYLCSMSEPVNYLSQVQDAFSYFLPIIEESLGLVIKKDISKYPIYVFSSRTFSIGTLLSESSEDSHGFSLYVTTTEEFIRIGVIPIEKAKSFVASYKPIATHCCLFVVPEDVEESRFIFYPRSS